MRGILADITISAKKPLPKGIPSNPKTIGEYIRKVRLERRLMQKEVAELLGVTTSFIENWEAKKNAPSKRYHSKIGDFLNYVPDKSIY